MVREKKGLAALLPLILVSLLALVVTWALFARHFVLVLGGLGAIVCALYFLKRPSFERSFLLMVFTLPFLYGFVFDIGVILRSTYLFTLLAFVLGLSGRKLYKYTDEAAVRFLLAFVVYALASTVFTLWIDFSRPMEAGAGLRLTPFRSFIQGGQLLLMVAAFYVTLGYLNNTQRLRRFANVIFWSTAIVTVYGIYEFVAALLGLPFFSVIFDTSYYKGGIDSPIIRFGGISLPRPRSTLGEPLDLSIFLFFSIPFCVAALPSNRKAGRWFKSICIVLGMLLFFVANSRSSLLALLVMLPFIFWLVGGWSARLRLLAGGFGVYLCVAGLMVVAGGRADIMGPLKFYGARLESVTYIVDYLGGNEEAASQLGRSYSNQRRVFEDNPFLGVGLGNYTFFYVRESGEIAMASTFSLYWRLLTELGLVGTSLFLLFVGTILLKSLRAFKYTHPELKPFLRASILALIGVMVARAGLDGLYTDNYIWVMLGAGVAIQRLASRSALVLKPPRTKV
jgi:hypothetical protein